MYDKEVARVVIEMLAANGINDVDLAKEIADVVHDMYGSSIIGDDEYGEG